MKDLARLYKEGKLALHNDGDKKILVKLCGDLEGEACEVETLNSDRKYEAQSKDLSQDHCFTQYDKEDPVCENCAIKSVCESTRKQLNKVTSNPTKEPKMEQPQTEATPTAETQEAAPTAETQEAAPVAAPVAETQEAAPVAETQEAAPVAEKPKKEKKKRNTDLGEIKAEKTLKDSEGNDIRLVSYKSGSYEVYKNGEKVSAKPFFEAFLNSKQIEIKPNAQTRVMGRQVFKALEV